MMVSRMVIIADVAVWVVTVFWRLMMLPFAHLGNIVFGLCTRHRIQHSRLNCRCAVSQTVS